MGQQNDVTRSHVFFLGCWWLVGIVSSPAIPLTRCQMVGGRKAMSGKIWMVFSAMCLLALLAFGIGPVFFHDNAGPEVSDAALLRLKTQHTIPYEGFHPRSVQVIQAHMTGPTLDHVEGTVVFRTLFGIKVGGTYDLDYLRWAGVWLLFLGAEVALGVYALRQVEI